MATADPTNLPAFDEVQFRTGKRVRPVVVTPTQLQAGIRYAYYDEPLVAPDENPAGAGQPFDPSSLIQGGTQFTAPEDGELVLDRNQPGMEQKLRQDTAVRDEPDRSPGDQSRRMAIQQALEVIAAGGGMSKELQSLVTPPQLLVTLVRLMVRRGICSVTELTDELLRS